MHTWEDAWALKLQKCANGFKIWQLVKISSGT